MKRFFQTASLAALTGLAGNVWAQEPANPLAKPQPEPAKAPEAPKDTAPPVPVVTLVEAGAEPRQAMRLTPAAGQEQAVKMRMLMSMSMKMDEMEYPKQAIPGIVMTFKTKVTSAETQGDIRYEFAFAECTVEEGGDAVPQVAEMIRSAIAPFSKITGTCLVTSRGITKDAKLVVPDNMDPGAASMLEGMKQQMGQMGAPFPEEPVGVGAKWKVATKVKSQGMTIDQTATVELLEMKDGVAKMSLLVEQAAPAQKINAPNGGEVDVKSYKASGSGKVEQKLAALAPSNSTMKMATDMSLAMNQGGEAHTMTQHIGLEMTFAPAEAAPAEKAADKPTEKPDPTK